MHPKVFSSILKAHIVHEIGTLLLRNRFSFNVRLLNENSKLILFIPAEPHHTHESIRKNGIMDNDSV